MSLTTPVNQLPEQLRERSQNSLFFTAQALLGYRHLTPHLHYEMASIAEAADRYKRVLCLVPRDHYKSTLFTISYPLWRGLRNPNETGLIVANTMKNATHFVGQIRSKFERANLLRTIYPELKPELSPRWNKDEVCLPREIDNPEATWEAAGQDTSVTSRHYDYIVYDDLVDENTYNKPELMKQLTDRFEQREGLLRPPIPERAILVVMNHWSHIDLASFIMEKHPEYFVYYRQAIEDGKPIFPEMYSMEWLLNKQKVDPYNFATQWMNNPSDASVAELKPQHLQYYKRVEDGVLLETREKIPYGRFNIYAAVDLRHATSTTPAQKMTSRNFITVGGIDPRGRRFLFEEWASRSDPVTLLNNIMRIHLKWHPIAIGVEGYGYQAALAPLAREVWKRESDIPNIFALPKDTSQAKDPRIRSGCSFFPKGLGFIHQDCVCFIEEYFSFPNGRTKDGLDSWAWLMTMMNAPEADDDRELEWMADRNYYKSLNQYTGI